MGDISVGIHESFYHIVYLFAISYLLFVRVLIFVDGPFSKSTTIKWKEGFNLSRSKHNTNKTNRKRTMEHKSFFEWFNDDSDPVSDDVGEIIKDDLWVNPLQYYLLPDMGTDNGIEDEESEPDDENDSKTNSVMVNEEENVGDVPNASMKIFSWVKYYNFFNILMLQQQKNLQLHNVTYDFFRYIILLLIRSRGVVSAQYELLIF